ncbi:EamA family transporter [Methanomassiliicoccaceae archaeon DOK]|nr:EamA family transporter [Methanomassiliicoccaceae archaeon DOK]
MMGKAAKAVVFAVLAAVFYAVSSPLSKILLEDVSPYLMAALLYLGAGIGMTAVRAASPSKRAEERPLTKVDSPYIFGMIVLDIAAPILLMYGLLNSPASSVSLLNNFEIVATTLIALLVFGERVTPTTWVAIILITISTVILSTAGTGEISFSHGSLAVILACVCWGLENNCTRRLSDSGALRIVVIKGIFSGLGALAIAVFMGMGSPSATEVMGALALGFVSYGMSLFFYITAQASLGAAKVSAYYAMAPFIGAFISLAVLGEVLTQAFVLALVFMAAGAVVLTRETLRPEPTPAAS